MKKLLKWLKSFNFLRKKEKEKEIIKSPNEFQIGDRVKWADHEIWLQKIGGSLGTVIKVDDYVVTVKWDDVLPRPMNYRRGCQAEFLIHEMYCWDFQERIKDRIG